MNQTQPPDGACAAKPNTTTTAVQIGNSDSRLSQQQWSGFVSAVRAIVTDHAKEIHFHGCSEGSRPWQNAAWIFEVEKSQRTLDALRAKLTLCRLAYGQDSIALTLGDTQFV